MKGGTETAIGFIPYRQHPLYKWLQMPVKLRSPSNVRTAYELRPPVKENRRLVYVLPSGEDFVE